MLALLLTALLMLPAMATAAPWNFEQPRDISATNGPGIFHHLGSGGRFGISVSSGTAGIVWEDNRDGVPRCYAALLDPQSQNPPAEWRLSGRGAAYEPAILGLKDGRFVVAWEEDGRVRLRMLTLAGLGPPLPLDEAEGAYVSLAWHPSSGLAASWARKEAAGYRTWIARLALPRDPQGPITLLERLPVEDTPADGDQTYTSAAYTASGRLVVAWEDQRHGHTVILASRGEDSGRFSPPQQINESFWGGREIGMGRGTGAMRVSLAALRSGKVLAVWADKRDFRSAYDVYGAYSSADGRRFGANQKVQDGFADGVAQWHPSAAASGAGELAAVVWDDDREGTPDLWLSWPEESGWSDDLDVPGASGEGIQSEPAVALDRQRGLHLAWVEKENPDSATRVRYLYAPFDPPPQR